MSYVKMKNRKVIICSSAICCENWLRMYDQLSKNKQPFHMVFCGHIKPEFWEKIESKKWNITYVEVDEKTSPAKCAEIAFRVGYTIKDAYYIVQSADDAVFHKSYLDNQVKVYEKICRDKKIPLMIGPRCKPVDSSEYVEGLGKGEWLLNYPKLRNLLSLVNTFTSLEVSKQLGSIDNRFHGLYWDLDRQFRMYGIGGETYLMTNDECKPTFEDRRNKTKLWNKTHKKDQKVLDNLWKTSESEDEMYPCTKYHNKRTQKDGHNEVFYKKFHLERTSNVSKYGMIQVKSIIGQYGDIENENIKIG